MCWRRVSRAQRVALLVTAYAVLYLSVSRWTAPGRRVQFVETAATSERPLLFLEAGAGGEPLSDAEGAEVFATRRCGDCFVTNNRGFLPMSAFDAVLVAAGRTPPADADTARDPQRRYVLRVADDCLRRKLLGCAREPALYPLGGDSGDSLDLCGLCAALHAARRSSRRRS